MCFQHARTKKEKMRLEEELDIFAKSQLKKIYNDRFAELKEVDFSQKHLQYLNRCKIGATGLGSSSFAHMVSLSLN
jgi:tartrate dehydratase alpha subunit/fumarate hydratase class I-like protein